MGMVTYEEFNSLGVLKDYGRVVYKPVRGIHASGVFDRFTCALPSTARPRPSPARSELMTSETAACTRHGLIIESSVIEWHFYLPSKCAFPACQLQSTCVGGHSRWEWTKWSTTQSKLGPVSILMGWSSVR